MPSLGLASLVRLLSLMASNMASLAATEPYLVAIREVAVGSYPVSSEVCRIHQSARRPEATDNDGGTRRSAKVGSRGGRRQGVAGEKEATRTGEEAGAAAVVVETAHIEGRCARTGAREGLRVVGGGKEGGRQAPRHLHWKNLHGLRRLAFGV